jgi:hypothetical protein
MGKAEAEAYGGVELEAGITFKISKHLALSTGYSYLDGWGEFHFGIGVDFGYRWINGRCEFDW